MVRPAIAASRDASPHLFRAGAPCVVSTSGTHRARGRTHHSAMRSSRRTKRAAHGEQRCRGNSGCEFSGLFRYSLGSGLIDVNRRSTTNPAAIRGIDSRRGMSRPGRDVHDEPATRLNRHDDHAPLPVQGRDKAATAAAERARILSMVRRNSSATPRCSSAISCALSTTSRPICFSSCGAAPARATRTSRPSEADLLAARTTSGSRHQSHVSRGSRGFPAPIHAREPCVLVVHERPHRQTEHASRPAQRAARSLLQDLDPLGDAVPLGIREEET